MRKPAVAGGRCEAALGAVCGNRIFGGNALCLVLRRFEAQMLESGPFELEPAAEDLLLKVTSDSPLDECRGF